MIGVAISTTGDKHRLPLLYRCITEWCGALPSDGYLFVTVDGDDEAFKRVLDMTPGYETAVIRVGQGRVSRNGCQGVAVSKNTGIEALIDAGVQGLFLSDDDTWPRSAESLRLHTDLGLAHSMVCWGRHRKPLVADGFGTWSWPRGAALYVEDQVIDALGGMDERFGPGGHEHVEWSRRIYQAGFTPHPFVTPVEYTSHGGTGAILSWHAEDMPRRGEHVSNLRARRRHLTSVRRDDADWPRIEAIMAERDGDTSFVAYRAAENGRESATLYHSDGA